MQWMTRDRSFYRTLVALSVPILFQNLITFGVNFSDNVLVGRLGDTSIAAVYLGNQVQLLVQMFMLGIAGALQVLSSQYWGRKDTERIRTLVALALRLTLGVTVLLGLLTAVFPERILALFTDNGPVVAEGAVFLRYMAFSFVFFGISQLLIAALRSVATVQVGLYVTIGTFVVNLFFNWILIFGRFGIPAMGVAGCALSTLIARMLEAAAMVIYVLFVDRKLRFRVRDILRTDRLLRNDYFKYGLPIIAGQLVWAANNLASGAILGHLGPEAITAASITGTLYALVGIASIGLAQAVGIVTGKTVGAGEFERMKLYARTVQVLFLGMGLLAAGIVLALARPFVGLYDVSDAARTVTLQFMAVLAVATIGTNYQGMSLGALVRAGGDTAFVFVNDTLFVFLTVLPSALLAAFVFHAPAWVVFACLKSDQITKCAVAVVKINRFDWMKNLTRGAGAGPAGPVPPVPAALEPAE